MAGERRTAVEASNRHHEWKETEGRRASRENPGERKKYPGVCYQLGKHVLCSDMSLVMTGGDQGLGYFVALDI
jgi:hypothetical protein